MSFSCRARAFVGVVGPLFFLFIAATFILKPFGALQDVSAAGLAGDPNQRYRFGFGISYNWGRGVNDYLLSLSQLDAGWYTDWSWRESPLRPFGIEYAQMIPVSEEFTAWEQLRRAARNNPGALWMIGNEPETRGQTVCPPWDYARRYHDLYYFIKGEDPTAQIANAGVVQITPLRLRWLDDMLAEYQARYGQPMPVDVWNIHVQILNESYTAWGCGVPLNDLGAPLYCSQGGQWVYCAPYGPGTTPVTQGVLRTTDQNYNPELFKQQVVAMRQWLKDRGQQNKPLIISEYGVLIPYGGESSISNFMKTTFDWMLGTTNADIGYPADGYRLVQRWNWFSLNTWPDPNSCPPGYSGNCAGYGGPLCEWNQDKMTAFGKLFRQYTNRSMRLAAGWNLISFPLRLNSELITQTLSSIEGKYDLAYAYDASDAASPWAKYNVALPFLNDLAQVNHLGGYWVRATSATDLYLAGRPLSLPLAISLSTGWNLVGYPICETRPLTVALASIAGKYDLVYEYDAFDTASPWAKYNVALPFLNDLLMMRPQKGYWIRVSEPCVWRVE